MVYPEKKEHALYACSVPGIEDVEHFILKCELCRGTEGSLLVVTEIRDGGGAAGRHSEDSIHIASGSEREGVARMIEKMCSSVRHSYCHLVLVIMCLFV